MSIADVQTFYGRWARAYDWLCRAVPGLGRLRRDAVDALALDAGDTVVDVGCGTGANFRHLRERVGPEGTVVGVDAAPGMLRVARERVDRVGWRNVHLVRADGACPPIEDVDGVFGSFVVGLFADPRSVVERWVDSLAPGGRVAVLEAARSDHPLGRRLNPAFEWFVAAGAPVDVVNPARTLDDRVDAARDALAARAALDRDERRAAGFLRLFAGARREPGNPATA